MPLRLLYSLIIYEIKNFLSSLFTLCYFFLSLKSVPIHVIVHVHVHVLMRDEKEERSKQCQTNNKAKQYSTHKAVTFPKRNELPCIHAILIFPIIALLVLPFFPIIARFNSVSPNMRKLPILL